MTGRDPAIGIQRIECRRLVSAPAIGLQRRRRRHQPAEIDRNRAAPSLHFKTAR